MQQIIAFTNGNESKCKMEVMSTGCNVVLHFIQPVNLDYKVGTVNEGIKLDLNRLTDEKLLMKSNAIFEEDETTSTHQLLMEDVNSIGQTPTTIGTENQGMGGMHSMNQNMHSEYQTDKNSILISNVDQSDIHV